jgi:proline iminopeptidase
VGRMPGGVREVLDRHEASGHTDCPEYTAATLQFYKRHLCRLDPWPDELERTWSRAGLDVYEAMWGPTEFYATGSLRGYDLSDRLGDISVATLFTCGRYDEAAPDTLASFAEQVPLAETIVFERSSHTPHLEERDAYAAAVRDFVGRVESTA